MVLEGWKAISPECDQLGKSLIEAYGALSYAHSRALQRYTGDAVRLVKTALKHLEDSGLDREDLGEIIEPLEEITKEEPVRKAFYPPIGRMSPELISDRIRMAQEELLEWAPNYIAGCECSKRK